MWEYIIKRVITEGEYIVEKGATVRAEIGRASCRERV